MGVIHVIATDRIYDITFSPPTTLLRVLRQQNVPSLTCIYLDNDGKVLPLSAELSEGQEIWAHSLRNLDFSILKPAYAEIKQSEMIVDLFRPVHSPDALSLVQFSRPQALDYAYSSFKAALDVYLDRHHPLDGFDSNNELPSVQIALSPGGDGRIVAECAHRYLEEGHRCKFHAVITANGLEGEAEHCDNAEKLATRFKLPFTMYKLKEAASLLGYSKDLRNLSEQYQVDFPNDELEVIGTYWVQEVNIHEARKNGRKAIIFGYNQEDVIADRLYQMLTGKPLPNFPIREIHDVVLLAPLSQVPKRMLDSLDLQNSMRNYSIRVPSVSYMRSSLYFLASIINEQFPAIADIISGSKLEADDPDEIIRWLNEK